MDIELNYRESGHGAPLILLHGNGESLDYFEHQMVPFSEHHRVIAVDTRGHGASQRGDKPFSISQFADDLGDFMDERSIEHADLLGFSDGGNIALTFALRHPERVDHLILDGANLDPSGVKRSTQIPIEVGFHLASLFSKMSAGARRRSEFLGLMVKEPHITPEQLSELEVRTLVIVGDRDLIVEAHTRLIADSLPDAELAIIPGSHSVAQENPDAFNRVVLAFLER